jgi:hypothetical protein
MSFVQISVKSGHVLNTFFVKNISHFMSHAEQATLAVPRHFGSQRVLKVESDKFNNFACGSVWV